MIKRIKQLLIITFIFLAFLNILKYFINNKKFRFFNQLYFNSPFILNKTKLCDRYQNLLENSLDSSFSASIINESGITIGSYNSKILRIPASNLKLFSTAYTLTKINPSDSIYTSLYKDNKNNFYLIGSGDPDLTLFEIISLLKKTEFMNTFNLNIMEINKEQNWPIGWTETDKLYSYGAPITSLALNSNQNKSEGISYIKEEINNFLKYSYPYKNFKLSIVEYDKKFKELNLVNKIPSNPFISLITLANSESHNFTAEALFKNSSKSWNYNNYDSLKNWLRSKGLPVKNISINDASGLSRNNKLTTNLTALFLYKMRYSNKFNFYNSTLSILGLRGTLANKMQNTNLKGRFFGKTGTLSNVFALSGYLYKNDETMTISIIQNSQNININKSFKLLKDIYKLEKCD